MTPQERIEKAKAESPFEILGFFEEIIDPFDNRLLGIRDIALPDRDFGYGGRKNVTFTEPVLLRTIAGKSVRIPASTKRPKTFISEIQMKCGRTKQPVFVEGSRFVDTATGIWYEMKAGKWVKL